MQDLTGQSIGRYHILEKLGAGGMAVVYKAYDTHLEREVAVKVIRREAFSPEVVERMMRRFEREAKALSKLTHANIVPIIDFGNEEGSPYLVMPLISGGTLKERMTGKLIDSIEATRILAPIARALDYAHSKGILHRDVKPSNILITDSGDPMLSDFGVAKILEEGESATITGTGMGLGTPEYMAPEQWIGKATSASDQYSLGVIFYEMVTGHKPYSAETPAAVLLKQASEPLPRPRLFNSDLPEKVEQILFKVLAKKSEDRYQSAAEFAAALSSLERLKEDHQKINPGIQNFTYPSVRIPKEPGTFDTIDRVELQTQKPTMNLPHMSERVDIAPQLVIDGKAKQVSIRSKKGLKAWPFLAVGAGMAVVVFLILLLSNIGKNPVVPSPTSTLNSISISVSSQTSVTPTWSVTSSPVVPTVSMEIVPKIGKLKVFGAYATPIEEPWDGVIHVALKKAAEDGLIDYSYTENIGYAGDMERILRDISEQQKPDLIVGDAWGNDEAIRKVAAEFPKIAFVFGTEMGPAGNNFAVFDNWIHDPAYLCGMLAGGMTETNTIGVIAAVPIPEVNRLVNAFIAGAKETNPEVKVLVSYLGSWFDPALAKEMTISQINAGADVLYAERAGVIEAAAEKGVYVFGNIIDQNSVAPEWVISSTVWNMTPTVEYVVAQVKAGTFAAVDLKDFSMMVKGGAYLASYHGNESKIPPELLTRVKAKEEDIKSGVFRVPIEESEPASVN